MGKLNKTYYSHRTEKYIFLIEKYGMRYVIGYVSFKTHICVHIGAFGYNIGFLIQKNGTSYDLNLSIWLLYISISVPHFRRWKTLKKD